MFYLSVFSGPSEDLLKRALEEHEFFVHFTVRVRGTNGKLISPAFKLYGEIVRLGKPDRVSARWRHIRFRLRDAEGSVHGNYARLLGQYSPIKQYADLKWEENTPCPVPMHALGMPDEMFVPLRFGGVFLLHHLRDMDEFQAAHLYAKWSTERVGLPMTSDVAWASAEKAIELREYLRSAGIKLGSDQMTRSEIYAAL